MKRKSAKIKSSKKSKTSKQVKPVINSDDLPATQGMLYHQQKMYKADIKSLEKKMDSRFNKVDAQFSQVDARFNQMDAKFSQVDARFNQMDAKFSQVDARFNLVDSKIEKVISEVHRIGILIEDQNNRNRFVLEGYEQIYNRQDRLDATTNSRLSEMEKIISKKSEIDN